MADSQFQVVVIGSGPGGYVAAIRCAQLGLKTAIIEKYSTLGGTCLNVGCIPSKALLDSSEHYHQALHQFSAHGIETGKLQLDLAKMIQRKNEVVKSTCDGVSFLMKKNKIQVFTGTGSFINNKEIKVTNSLGEAQTLIAEKVIIATGSKPISLPGVTLDKTRIITSTEALNLPEVPKHLIIIGGGVIGLELGSVYARLGAKVSVVEYTEGLIPSMDKSLGKELQKNKEDKYDPLIYTRPICVFDYKLYNI
jgi:dihydrolipoamide dehydrogenase